MHIKYLTLAEATERHPREVEKMLKEAARKLQRSRSKKKGKDVSELVWSYEYSVEVQSYSAKDMLNGTMHRANVAFNKLSLEEKVADQCKRTRCCLKGHMPGASVYFFVPNPTELEEQVRAAFEAREKEEARVSALSPEERDQELRHALKTLRRGRGFVAL